MDKELEGIANSDFDAFIAKTLTPADTSDAEPDSDDDDELDDDELEDDDADDAEDGDDADDDEDSEDEDDDDDSDEEDESDSADDDDADEPPPAKTKRTKAEVRLTKIERELAETREQLRVAAQLATDREAALTKRDEEVEKAKSDRAVQDQVEALKKRWSDMKPEEVAAEQQALVLQALRESQNQVTERDRRDEQLRRIETARQQHEEIVQILAAGGRVIDGKLIKGHAKPLTEDEIEDVRAAVWQGEEMQKVADRALARRTRLQQERRALLAKKRRRENGDAERSGTSREGTRRQEAEREPTTIDELIDQIDFLKPRATKRRELVRR